ncbi:MAG: ATPase [Thiohalocapsa sp.]|uniref:V-type ATP synthase subunit I n=1 Tax=Thiohalocapsa sp. TaxID=2497641 RepID=UPI0025D4D619|nr:V-type ATPase 116kDa subunit family protein [Thiohalocapsa sp.]MCG6940254.1 ATPase [Thiohalocapsa sp.]
MLRPLPMKHVRLLVMTDDLPQASLTLAETESFHPDERPPESQALAGVPGREYREHYRQAATRLDKIAKLVDVPATPPITQLHVVHPDELAAVGILLRERWEEASRFEESFRRLDDEERFIRDQEASLANFANLKIDLGKLRSKTRFLDFYVGMVPRENVSRLQGAVQLADHLLFNYLERGDSAHVIIVGPRGEGEAELSSVLTSAGFQALPIPSDIAGMDPARKREELQTRRAELAGQRETLRTELTQWGREHHETLVDARRTLLLAEPFVNLGPAVHSAGHLAMLAGWVPARAVAKLDDRLGASLALPFDMTVRNPRPDERALVPTVPARSPLLAPFTTLVKQYGIPQYGEIDPTPLFAVTFLLMFGMMFGDVGHGAVIALTAFLFRRKLKGFAWLGIALGLSSMLFGFVFGSVFGVEDWLPALWMSPLHDPILMLKVALGWGIAFIIVACLLGIYNRVVTGNIEGAIFAPHGAVNLLFYLGFLVGGYGLATAGRFGWVPMLAVVGALSALAVYQWRHLTGPIAEKALIVFIETLDTVIVYLSNTLSFLRVSAFSLNHAALAIAIFTLADMLGTVGTVITLILGNLFILVLEGGIVMIQVMRLEYYEGFSRYFSGDGHEFTPLRLRRGTEAS